MKTAPFAIAILLVLISASAHAKPGQPVFDRHAVHSVGSEPTITERAVRKVRTAGLKQIRRKHQKQHRQRIAPPANYAVAAPLVEKARSFLGTNPTGWSRVWCGRFMAMIAPDLAARVSNPNLARAWASLPRSTPQVGAIVVLSRGRNSNAGHIGVVTGFDADGNPRVVSGNHNRRVAEGVYSKHRVIAYVGGN